MPRHRSSLLLKVRLLAAIVDVLVLLEARRRGQRVAGRDWSAAVGRLAALEARYGVALQPRRRGRPTALARLRRLRRRGRL